MTIVRLALFSCAALAIATAIACSSSDDTPSTDTTGGDASVDADPFPVAPHAAGPQVVTDGGPTLAKPKIIPIFFPSFAQRTTVVDFVKKLPLSTYWKQATAEYGVGDLVEPGAPIDVKEAAPPVVSESDIGAWLTSRFDGSHPEFGTKPIEDAIYTLYYPPATTLQRGDTDGGANSERSCGDFAGYHGSVDIKGVHVVFAAIASCEPGARAIPYSTYISSHEWVEAATDPLVLTKPAYSSVDQDHIVWALLHHGGEVADMCELQDDTYFVPDDLGFSVQRVWSNAAAKAGSNPCVPAAPGPYFNVAPVLPRIDTGAELTQGVVVYSGESKTVKFDFYSDGPTDLFDITATPYELSSSFTLKATTTVTATVTPSAGKNGDRGSLTVHTVQHSPFGLAIIVLTSTLGKTTHESYVLVSN